MIIPYYAWFQSWPINADYSHYRQLFLGTKQPILTRHDCTATFQSEVYTYCKMYVVDVLEEATDARGLGKTGVQVLKQLQYLERNLWSYTNMSSVLPCTVRKDGEAIWRGSSADASRWIFRHIRLISDVVQRSEERQRKLQEAEGRRRTPHKAGSRGELSRFT